MSIDKTRRFKAVDQRETSLIDLPTLRRQCEIVATEIDSDGVEVHPDDELLLGYLEAAVDHAEDFLGEAVGLNTFEIALDEFPDGNIELPRGPYVDLVSFYVGDESDGIVDPDSYTVDDYGQRAELVPVTTWPTVLAATNTIKIRWRAGYSTTVEGAPRLPKVYQQALLLLVGHFYANREDATEKALATIPNGFEALLRPRRVRLGMA